MTLPTIQIYEVRVNRFSGQLKSNHVDTMQGETRAEASRARFAANDNGRHSSVYVLASPLHTRDWSGWDGVNEDDVFMTGDQERQLFGH